MCVCVCGIGKGFALHRRTGYPREMRGVTIILKVSIVRVIDCNSAPSTDMIYGIISGRSIDR